jgi:hypothetical protein
MIGISLDTNIEESFARGWYVHLNLTVQGLSLAHCTTKKEALLVQRELRKLAKRLHRIGKEGRRGG